MAREADLYPKPVAFCEQSAYCGGVAALGAEHVG
jgi:hypothetical protein